jgi:hypothetical protein
MVLSKNAHKFFDSPLLCPGDRGYSPILECRLDLMILANTVGERDDMQFWRLS